MQLTELIQGLPIRPSGSAPTDGLDVVAVCEDSRRIEAPGALFVARAGGVHDGARFIDDAVAGGAAAVLTLPGVAVPAGVVHLCADDPGALLAELAERVCGRPSAELALIGITGTNGKSTVAWLLREILATAGLRCGLMGTVGTDLGDGRRVPAALTTPGAVEISSTLAAMRTAGCTHAVMEVSSHALDQGRAAALCFAGAIFTNLSGDHLDYHGTMTAYAAAKARLFAQLDPDAWAVLNADDGAGATMARAARTDRIGWTTVETAPRGAFAARPVHAGVTGTDIAFTADGAPWIGVTGGGRLPLVGRHNVSNALQAATAATALGVPAPVVLDALSRITAPPGRLEPVHAGARDVHVYVDYAHTDDALDHALSALRPLVAAPHRLRVVFGCGGDRDRTKRPRMAQAAARWADDIVITSDNPRTEDPDGIVDEIARGVPVDRRDVAQCIVDRRDAIDVAISASAPGDVVLIAGKGHEDYQIIGTEKRPFDDREVAREALRRVR